MIKMRDLLENRLIEENQNITDILTPYIENPYGIHSSGVSLKDGKFYLYYKDILQRNKSISKLKELGIKKVIKNKLDSGYKTPFQLIIYTE